MATNTHGLSAPASDLLEALRKNVEYIDANQWGCVYLDNVPREGMTRHQFAGYLSALEDKGLYRPDPDGFFGYVKV